MVLVTGASGFVGQHLVKHLSEQGHTVRALYHNTPPTTEQASLKNVTWLQCNLLDIFDVEIAMDGIDEIYHCAGIVSFHPKDKDMLLHFNVESTANIVNEALVTGVRKMVHVSSVAALGRSEQVATEITEEEQWEESNYNSAYGLSKHMAEMEVWRGVGEGLSAVIINPATILGTATNWDTGSARLMKVADKEFPFYTDGVTAWVDVADVVKAACMLMQSDIEAERFILSAGNYSFKEVFTRMADALGKKPPHIRAGAFLSGLVWRWNILRSFFAGITVTVTRETARTAQKKNYYNNSKLLKYLPSFNYTPINQTITSMANKYLKKPV